MPWRSSASGSPVQVLHAMQWVRLVRGGEAPGQLARKAGSWSAQSDSREASSKFWHPVLRCSPNSKPAAWKRRTSASVMGELGYMYEVERMHCQSATEQPGALRSSKIWNWPAV